MARLKVLLLPPFTQAVEARKTLARDYDVIDVSARDRSDFLEHCRPGGRYATARALCFGAGANAFIGSWDRHLVDSLPPDLRFICSIGAGYNQYAPILELLTAKGIQLSHTPGSVDDATSTAAFFLLLSCFRHFYVGQKRVRDGRWNNEIPLGHDLAGKTLGIVGMGGIGRRLAGKCVPFGMQIAYHNRHRLDDEAVAPGVTARYCESLDDLLASSDAVSISVPLSDATRHLMSRAQFATMRKGSILINTSRGEVVDQEALLDALDAGHIASAGLDVFPQEPSVDRRLRDNESLTLTPHMGTWTVEAIRAMEAQVLDNARAGLETGSVIDLVPEQRGKV